MVVETFKIKGWKEKEGGLIIDENDDWILVKHIPMDYQIDGYKLYRKEFVKKRKSKSHEALIEKVLRLKKVSNAKPKGFKFQSILDTLKWSEKKYGLFEFKDGEERELHYGKFKESNGESLIIDMVLADGEIDKEYDFEYDLNKIRSISFESDYFNSIQLLMTDKAQA